MKEETRQEIVELQTRLQFQDDVIQKLDDAIILQGELLDRLVRRLAMLEDRLEQLAHERETRDPGDNEKPPHY